MSKTTPEYHILSLSGGKDSTALAFFMKENMPEIFEKLELVFCDTECELPELYDYLNKIEIFLNKKITYIKPPKSFENFYDFPIWWTLYSEKNKNNNRNDASKNRILVSLFLTLPVF